MEENQEMEEKIVRVNYYKDYVKDMELLITIRYTHCEIDFYFI